MKTFSNEFVDWTVDDNKHMNATVTPDFAGGLTSGVLIAKLTLNRAVRDGLIDPDVSDALFEGFGDEVLVQLRSLQQDPVFRAAMGG